MKNADTAKTSQKKQGKANIPGKTGGKVSGWLSFLKEVKVEMKKVTWPPRKEIIGSTMALIVATVLIGVFLGIVDMVLAQGIQPALTGKPEVMSYITLFVFAGILFWVFKSN